MKKKLILTEYKRGLVLGVFNSMDEVNEQFEKESENNSSLRDPQWYPQSTIDGLNNGESLVFLHYYCAGDSNWHASHRLTEIKI